MRIAFELLSLQWQKQFITRAKKVRIVVNCFRMTIFAVAKTISWSRAPSEARCELLSNDYLCSGKNNYKLRSVEFHKVVNCFRMTIFAVAKTIYEFAKVDSIKL